MEPETLNYFRSILLASRNHQLMSEIKWDDKPVAPQLLVYRSKDNGIEEKFYAWDAKKYETYIYESEKADDDQIIHITPVQGPVTHGGAPCANGTRELADAFLFADNHPKVVGHLVILDTPGGSASANDLNTVFQNAQKPIVGLIRGINASKGVYISTDIPNVYAENGSMEIGCIGTMWQFAGIKSGTEYKGEIFYELYASQSGDKNGMYREAIQNGNTKPAQEELDRLAAEFITKVKTRWPGVKEERLTGKMYPASEVIGELVDGILSYEGAIDKIFELAGVERLQKGKITPGGMLPATGENNNNNSPESTLSTKLIASPSATEVTEEEQTHKSNPQNPLLKMDLTKLQSILGTDIKATVDENDQVVMTQELNEAVLSALENAQTQAATLAREKTQLEQTVSQKDQQITELAKETRPFETGAALDDSALEKDSVVEGSILDGIPPVRNQMNIGARMVKVEAFAKEMGLMSNLNNFK